MSCQQLFSDPEFNTSSFLHAHSLQSIHACKQLPPCRAKTPQNTYLVQLQSLLHTFSRRV